MANLFSEPSTGSAKSDSEIAFKVSNNGQCNAIWAENNSSGFSALVGKNNGNMTAIYGENNSDAQATVVGENHGTGEGIRGISNGVHGAIVGVNNSSGTGVFGLSEQGEGVRGETKSNDHGAVVGVSNGNAPAVFGISANGEGVHGETKSNDHGAVVGVSNGNAPAVFGKGRLAGVFEGDVEVKGDVRLTGADCAEEFNINSNIEIESGTVMVLDNKGNLQQSHSPYDKKVAGIVSGAGIYKPALVLDRIDNCKSKNRLPIALMGKVYCKVDASISPIEVGDLLTTSYLQGHAMKAQDPYKAFGSVIGKALGSLKDGVGLIPVLVSLQ